eukprot:2986248-Lingulodinium_polyedra.AAC.1
MDVNRARLYFVALSMAPAILAKLALTLGARERCVLQNAALVTRQNAARTQNAVLSCVQGPHGQPPGHLPRHA